ncbi:MAG: class I SAM-dependent methyltransferase [Candidatus Gracilibacteria bacterium]|jgi:ubiquinone/menaquinone biosynthesis C-methylase UbiE|nr:class I SAM-dependent methyltransferase [Candidatus Gracilibacteria bacterium]
MNRQEFYRDKYKAKNSEWMDSQSIYKILINERVNTNTKILDIGCGHGDFMKEVYDKTNFSFGIDPDASALEKNSFIKNKFVASAEKLPFQDNTFDIVVSAWVLEHIQNPRESFSEIFRVLKPGGKVIFLTPNVWNYNVWIIRAIPERFHEFFTKRLYNRKDHDTYPKSYKINSEKSLMKTLTPIGFQKSEIIFNGDPSYISFNEPLFKFASLIETLLDKKPLRFMKVHLIGVFEK